MEKLIDRLKVRLKFIAIAVIVVYCLGFIRDNCVIEPIIKEAVHMDYPGDNVIWCKPIKTTGFDWEVVAGDENRCCNIKGPDPMNDIPFKYDFEISDNIYIFYVKEKTYDPEYFVGGENLEYTVSGWDILYPVKRGNMITGIFKSQRYILKSDLMK